jgi:PilZ domain
MQPQALSDGIRRSFSLFAARLLSALIRVEFTKAVAYAPVSGLGRRKVQTMLTITPRAARVSMPIPIMFRRTGEEDWLAGKVVNLSESGVLFGPTELAPGTMVEVLLSPPVQVGSLTTGKQVCAAEVVRASDIGATAVRFDECRFLLE